MTTGGDDRVQTLRAVLEKRSILAAVTAGEAVSLRELVDATEFSRSTVNRTVNDFEEMGLVRIRRADARHHYECTYLGRQLLTLVDCAHEFLRARGMFAGVADDADLPPWLVADASLAVAESDESTPHHVFDQIYDVAERADRLKILAPVLTRDATFHHVADRVVSGELVAELVFPEAHVAAISDRFETEMVRMRASGNLTVLTLEDEELPYGFGINYVDGEDGTERIVGVVCYDEAFASANGTLVSADPATVAWAEATYERYRDSATMVAGQG